jgi:hypothetical protein
MLKHTHKLMALTTPGLLAVSVIFGIAGCTEPRSATEQRVSSPATAQGLEPAPIGVMDYHSPRSSRWFLAVCFPPILRGGCGAIHRVSLEDEGLRTGSGIIPCVAAGRQTRLFDEKVPAIA